MKSYSFAYGTLVPLIRSLIILLLHSLVEVLCRMHLGAHTLSGPESVFSFVVVALKGGPLRVSRDLLAICNFNFSSSLFSYPLIKTFQVATSAAPPASLSIALAGNISQFFAGARGAANTLTPPPQLHAPSLPLPTRTAAALRTTLHRHLPHTATP